MIDALSTELFGSSRALPQFPQMPEIRGAGISDWFGYAEPLATKFDYTNTYYHQEPRLDIASPKTAWEGRFDFIIASDVLEHVRPPVSRALEGMRRLLTSSGFAVLTVPYAKVGDTVEHFPDLHDFEVIREGERTFLRNTTRDGLVEEFHDLVYHGGDGATLEMRMFSERGLVDALRAAGFDDVRICNSDSPKWGIVWPEDWSLPVVARPTWTS